MEFSGGGWRGLEGVGGGWRGLEGVGGGGEASELDKKRRGLEQSQQKQSGKWSWELAAFLSPFSLPFLEKINWKLSSFLFCSFFSLLPDSANERKEENTKIKEKKNK